jgi:AcrR family transcriptional regulator
MSTNDSQRVAIPRSRGRPRSAKAHAAILAAARSILLEEGLTAVTMEAIAARAKVGKPTIYRSWPNAYAVAMSALMSADTSAPTLSRSSSAIAELKAQLRAVAKVFASRTGRQVTMMIASAESETELSKSFRNHFILARREEGREILRRAISRNEVRENIDMEVALDMIYGPVFYRLLIGHGGLDESFADGVVDQAVRGIAGSR